MAKVDKQEAQTVETMAHCYGLARELFGDKANDYATEEIYDYLEASDDPEDFMADLRRVIDHAKTVYQTQAPSPEQVFGLFERLFGE